MKKADIEKGKVYQTKINGKWCSVRVTASRQVTDYFSSNGMKTLFDWVRLYPPPGAKALRGSDPASKLRPVSAAHPLGDVEPADFSGDPGHDAVSGGEPVPSYAGDVDPLGQGK